MGHKIKSIPCPLSPEEKSALLQVFPQGIVAFDLETTGLSPLLDEIIEIGAIKITADETVLFESFINPQRMIPESTIKIHGITDDMVKSAPLSSEVMPEFLEFNQGLPLFAHNARFDVGFIIRACQKLILNPGKGPVYCSCQLSRFAFKEAPNHRLKTLAEYLTLPLLNHHRAFDDAKACLMIIAKGMLKYQNENLRSGKNAL